MRRIVLCIACISVFAFVQCSKDDGSPDYGNVRWGMTIEEARKALENGGRVNLQTTQQDYSKWYDGADYGISATYRPEPGVELWELYLFKKGKDSDSRTLVCMGFAANYSAREKVEAMLKAKYGEFVPKAENVKNQKLLDLEHIRQVEQHTTTYYKKEYGIQTSRVTGIFHSISQQSNYVHEGEWIRIDVTLIPAWDNK